MLEDAVQRITWYFLQFAETSNHLSSGESLLHVLIICDSPIHTRIARLLLKNFPKSALDKVEGEEYLGRLDK